ncbi:MAG: ABC transporter transmembrane domain-containing protein [Oligoflexales bacterium]
MLAALRKVFFVDVGFFLSQNTSKPTKILDLPELPTSLDPHYIGIGFKNLPLASDWAFLFSCIRGVFHQALGMSLCAVLMLIFDLISPQLIFHILGTFEGVASGSMNFMWGVTMAFFFALNSTLQALANQHYYYYGLMGVQACINGLNSRIYDKALQISVSEQKKRSLGSMVNNLGSDSEAVADFLWVVVELSYSVILAIFATISLSYFLGWAGVIASFILLLLVPVSKLLGQNLIRDDYAKMQVRDKRVGLITQIVNGIMVIKCFRWESYIKLLVKDLRNQEINIIDRINFFESISRFMYSGISIFISFAGFGLYAYSGNQLAPSKVFASLALFKIMEQSFSNFTELIAQISVSRVAASRIQKFLNADNNKNPRSSYFQEQISGLELTNFSCAYSNKGPAVLRNLNLKIKSGENVAVVGLVGSGKSAFLQALLGEMCVLKGNLSFGLGLSNSFPRILWSGQNPFICNLSIVDNICFGKVEKEIKKYLILCDIDKDIDQLESGLNTHIGQQGLKLSGGQNQRLNLVRAAFHDAPLVILDDPFSAVDMQTELQIIDYLICGLWKNKTRIVATQRLQHIEKFDRIIYLEKGELAAEGSLQDLLLKSSGFQQLYEKTCQFNGSIQLPQEADLRQRGEGKTPVTGPLKATDKPIYEYDRVKSGAYWEYIKAMTSSVMTGRYLILLCLILSSFLVSIMPLILNSWLSVWSSDTTSPAGFTLIEQVLIPLKSTVISEVMVYGIMSLVFIGLYFFHHRFWSQRSLHAGKILHENALSGLLGSSSHFFDCNPIGKILNRFSHDCDIVEKKLPWSFELLIRAGISITTTLGILICVIPDIIFLLLPVIYVYCSIQKVFRKKARDVKILASIHKSPRLAQFKEMLEGLTVIRAFGCEQFFREKFYETQRNWQKAFHGMILLNRWLSIRIPLLSSLLTFGVILRLMYAASKQELEVGTAGVVLSYTLYLWEHFNRFARSFSESEAHLIAVERLQSFSFLEQEKDDGTLSRNSSRFFYKGKIEFQDVSVSYEAGSFEAIKNISLKISCGEKIGIRGRSGAGKTTLIKTLLRMVPSMIGQILLDGINIFDFTLDNLRSSIAVVPQNPILFSGNIRSNLDPQKKFSNESILESLKNTFLFDIINDRGGLNAEVSENGDNFSVGEKQLLCLARGILIDSPIIILDEATASVDEQTDYRIKRTIEESCVNKTMLIIAHRQSTLESCHKIIELENGCLVSFSA